jgi:hypothetical protein
MVQEAGVWRWEDERVEGKQAVASGQTGEMMLVQRAVVKEAASRLYVTLEASLGQYSIVKLSLAKWPH